jgi:hypothetical protein
MITEVVAVENGTRVEDYYCRVPGFDTLFNMQICKPDTDTRECN